jgi:hypothetical protein
MYSCVVSFMLCHICISVLCHVCISVLCHICIPMLCLVYIPVLCYPGTLAKGLAGANFWKKDQIALKNKAVECIAETNARLMC